MLHFCNDLYNSAIPKHSTRPAWYYFLHRQESLILVEQTGIEPVFSDFQSDALTNFATVPFFDNLIGFEPIIQESKSWVLPLHHRLFCKLNRTWTHTPRFEMLCIHEYLFLEIDMHELNLVCFPLHHKLILYSTQDSNLDLTALKTVASSIWASGASYRKRDSLRLRSA